MLRSDLDLSYRAATPILPYSMRIRGIHVGSRYGKRVGSGKEPLAIRGSVGKLCAE